jgi:hypothetical protein
MKITNQIRELSKDDRFFCLNYVHNNIKLFKEKKEFKKALKVIIKKAIKEKKITPEDNLIARYIYCLLIISQYPIVPKLRHRS